VIIDSFTGKYEFLSNLWIGAPIQFGPYTAMSGEHLFQAMKCADGLHFRKILAMPTPVEAKAEGRHLLRPRPDWQRVKLDVMRMVLGVKFTHQREESRLLLDTGDALLVDGSPWGDGTWGVVTPKGSPPTPADVGVGRNWLGVGRNWLGVLLMARRAELGTEAPPPVFDYYASTLDFIRYRPATEDR
jgi:ribA/ribD-fused uncharacterized protein